MIAHGKPWACHREQTVTINTAAAGGNAALLSDGE
jgi:delta 1-pyrroline-5-carboxylate dehydrogenase